ncbi:MAG: hypothetical protein IT225_11165 [Flavobacteriales bacterium]|jgi:hypothetical protein|nr:hypothetical protein [Flavobacteriales bacterium]
MGLYIKTLATIPASAQRKYFIYLLDYGWHEQLSEVLEQNYDKMAALAADSEAVVVRGLHQEHFTDEVLSWHNVNGESAEGILPAVLITNRNPSAFRENGSSGHAKVEDDLKLVLIPLRLFCRSSTDVVVLIDQLFKDIKAGKDLDDFKVAKVMRRGTGRALADAIILEPNIAGIGLSIKKLFEFLRPK